MLKDRRGSTPVIVLIVIAVVAVAVIVVVNMFSKDTAYGLQESFPEADGFNSLSVEDSENHPRITAVYSAESSGEHIGYAIEAFGRGYGGDLPLVVGFTKEGVVTGVTVLANAETPGLGSQVEDPEFVDQFMGTNALEKYSTSMLDGGNIDIVAITGATVSCKAGVQAVNAASDYFSTFLSGEDG